MVKKSDALIRVAFVTVHYPPSSGFGGVCESSFGLTQALAELGLKIDVITSDASFDRRIPKKKFAQFQKRNINIYPFKYLFSKRNCFSLEAKKIMKKQFVKADIVHINGIVTHPSTVAASLARSMGKPYIMSPRGGLADPVFKRKYIKKLISYHCYVAKDISGAVCVHASNPGEIESFARKNVPGPYAIIPNGITPVDISSEPINNRIEKELRILRGKNIILYLGRLSKEKGLELLISAWSAVYKHHHNSLLVIAGPGKNAYSRKIKKKISYNLKNTILFTGLVEGELKQALIRKADLIVLPSYSESFGNVVAESLANGTPVVTTEGTPWKIINEINCGLWVPINEDAISSAMIRILNKMPGERREMGLRGKEYILRNHSWDKIARKFLTLYQSVIEKNDIPLYPKPWYGEKEKNTNESQEKHTDNK